MKSGTQIWTERIILLFVGIVVPIISLEIWIRGSESLWSIGYKVSENYGLIYELMPDFYIERLNAKISAQGFRDFEYTKAKRPDVYRIAVVGDSTSFGWKIQSEASFPKQIEKMLRGSGINAEVINFSVPGYNTTQELEILREKALMYSPDLVILSGCKNDIGIPPFIKPDLKHLSWLFNKSYLFRLIAYRLDLKLWRSEGQPYWWSFIKKNLLKMHFPSSFILPTPGLEKTPDIDGHPPSTKEAVPEFYWGMVGIDNFILRMKEIVKLLEENKINFLTIGFWGEELREAQLKSGVHNVIDLDLELPLRGYEISTLQISNTDDHLNEKGHEIVAKILLGSIPISSLAVNHSRSR